MQKGNIGVTTENIFPIIKQFLYSDHEIFLRELVSNAVDATQKLKTLASIGEFKEELGDITVNVSVDKDKKIIKISDHGVGMTAEEIDKYINQVAFSGANDFLEKYQKDANAIIGHFGLGFYSSFMVSKKVEIITKSYKEGAKAVKWSCTGNPEYEIEEVEKETRGTDIILHIDDDSKEYADDAKINELLTKYCKFLPVEIAFGKKKDWKDGKEVETDEYNVINDPNPLWTKTPTDIKDEEYNKFYKDLYPATFEDPLFNIHLNVDYPFNLTGILYFPKIKNNIEVQRNKIQLYCNQVFVTDSVEGIVPEFLTLLHGVIDSPDIPLNVSRSYLQSDRNVKKISNHITKKVADRLEEIFKNQREEFEQKWDNLKVFIQYGMLTDEKFYERAQKFYLFKNTEGKYYTIEEYNTLIKDNQTDKNDRLVHLYTNDEEGQFSFIEAAKNKGYDVLVMDGQLDSHFINHLESKLEKSGFSRVDADTVDKLIQKDETKEVDMPEDKKDEMIQVFQGVVPAKENYFVNFENLSENDNPLIITQNEFMRRMKDMSKMGGGQMSMYGDMPDNLNLVVNVNHPLVKQVMEDTEASLAEEIEKHNTEINPLQEEVDKLQEAQGKKKDEEVTQAEKDELEDKRKKLDELKTKKNNVLREFGKNNKLAKQLVDLALLANNMLKGEDLNKFVKRSVELIK